MSDVFDRVKVLVKEHLDPDVQEISKEASIKNDLGADSLDVVELIMALEEEFELEIPDEDAEGIDTVGNIVDYINRRQESQG